MRIEWEERVPAETWLGKKHPLRGLLQRDERLAGSRHVSFSFPAELPPPQDCLLTHVRVEDGYRPVAEALFRHVAVVEDLQAAAARFNRNGVFQTIVTRRGDIVTSQGAFVGGGGDATAGILAQKQEIRDLAARIQKRDQQIAGAREVQS